MARYKGREHGGVSKEDRVRAKRNGQHIHNGHRIEDDIASQSDEVFNPGQTVLFLGRKQIYVNRFPELERGFLVQEQDGSYTFTETAPLRFSKYRESWTVDATYFDRINPRPILPQHPLYRHANAAWTQYFR